VVVAAAVLLLVGFAVLSVCAVYEGVNSQAGNSPPDTGGLAAPSKKDAKHR
jgi:hypothetical protein